MAIEPFRADAVAAQIAALYSDAELALVRRISRRLARGLDAGDWATRRLGEVAAVRRAAQLLADKLYVDSSALLREGIAAGYRAGNRTAVVDLTEQFVGSTSPAAREADRNGSAVQALADAAVAELRPVRDAILPGAERAYRQAIAGAVGRTLAGAQTRREAAQDAWQALVDRGITSVRDSGGRTWRLHTYVETATRTSLLRAQTQGVVDELSVAGHRLVYVVSRGGSCPMCAPWEHQVLALWGTDRKAKATLAQARDAGLQHPNCRHEIRPWTPTTRLATVIPDPKRYEAIQQQRSIERNLRHWREREAAALTAAAETAARARVRAWDDELVRHLDEHDLPRLRYREQPGAGHVPPASRRRDAAF